MKLTRKFFRWNSTKLLKEIYTQLNIDIVQDKTKFRCGFVYYDGDKMVGFVLLKKWYYKSDLSIRTGCIYEYFRLTIKYIYTINDIYIDSIIKHIELYAMRNNIHLISFHLCPVERIDILEKYKYILIDNGYDRFSTEIGICDAFIKHMFNMKSKEIGDTIHYSWFNKIIKSYNDYYAIIQVYHVF
jgi:hypothetical protein